ncbi:MAG TPA: WbqC family protein [Gemmatimonadaceae bacterium]
MAGGGNREAGSGKRVAIVQSNYIPWKGYFDMIGAVDEFILYDDVQYTRRDWRNRNKIKTTSGIQWLTIPVEVKGKYTQRVRDVVVSEPAWARTHWRTLLHQYAAAPHFRDLKATVEGWYDAVADMKYLTEINEYFLRAICGVLEIGTPIKRSSDFELVEGRSERLLDLCAQAGAKTYLSGPAARAYLDEKLFEEAGITVRWMEYGGYPEYPQLHLPFEHGVTVLDLLFNTGGGASARSFMKIGTTHARA